MKNQGMLERSIIMKSVARRPLRLWILGGFLLVMIFFSGWILTDFLERFIRKDVRNDAIATAQAVDRYLLQMLAEVDRNSEIMSGSPWLIETLTSPQQEKIRKADSVLDRYCKHLEDGVCYVMNTAGDIVASSNRDTPESFVGKNYGFRPYFQEAMAGRKGTYFALGVTSRKRGYYASNPVRSETGEILGVAVIKIGLARAEELFKKFEHCYLASPQGIVFLSSDPLWILKALWPLPDSVKEQVQKTQQFGPGPFPALFDQELMDGQSFVMHSFENLIVRIPLPKEGWSIVFLKEGKRIFLVRLIGNFITLFLSLLLFVFFSIIGLQESSNRLIRQSEERFRQIAMVSQDWIWELDKEGRYTFSNQAVQFILGYEPQEVIGKPFADFLDPEHKDQITEQMKDVISRRGTVHNVIHVNTHQDGHRVSQEITCGPFFDFQGTFLGYRGVSRDVTERMKSRQLLEDSAMQWRRTFDAIPDMIFILDKDFNIILANQACLKNLKKSYQEIIGSKCHQLMHCSAQPWPHCPNVKLQQDLRVHTEEVDDPKVGLPLLVTTSPILNEKGEFIGSVHIAKDISERKKMEKELLARLEDLKQFREMTLGREERMIQMKHEINRLAEELGRPAPYDLSFIDHKPKDVDGKS